MSVTMLKLMTIAEEFRWIECFLWVNITPMKGFKIFEPALFSIDRWFSCRKVRAFNALLPLILSESMYRTISRQKA